jgi:hypothetical protein
MSTGKLPGMSGLLNFVGLVGEILTFSSHFGLSQGVDKKIAERKNV